MEFSVVGRLKFWDFGQFGGLSGCAPYSCLTEWKRNPSLYPPYLRARVGKGLGTGAQTEYRAWRNVRNSGNVGTIGFVHGIRVGRRYEIPDQRSKTYFYLLERVHEIVDIREL
jgi:hypothetical protein